MFVFHRCVVKFVRKDEDTAMFRKIKGVFPGGIHPTDGRDKLLTYNKPIERFRMKEPGPPREYELKPMDVSEYKRHQLLEVLEESELVGMGGAGFPTSIKYKTDKDIETVLINAAECEPYLTCDFRLMVECAPVVVNGILLLKKAAGAKCAVICIEDNKRKAADILMKITEGLPGVEICILPVKYPQGGERQLIQTVLGVEVPMGGFPADVGVIVSNVATAKAAADIVFGHEKPVSRVVTVTGAVSRPANYLAPVGTPLKDLLLESGGVTCRDNMVIIGGPMTGKCVAVNWHEEDLGQVQLTTSGLVVIQGKGWDVRPCIRCGACIGACPAGLSPINIETAYLKGKWDICKGLYASECISCGCCSYVCPAKRELAYHITEAKNMLKKRRDVKQ